MIAGHQAGSDGGHIPICHYLGTGARRHSFGLRRVVEYLQHLIGEGFRVIRQQTKLGILPGEAFRADLR